METKDLISTVNDLVGTQKGILAMDESTPTCNKRFAKLGIPETEECRRSYREMIVTTAGLGKHISGAILYDETIRQTAKDGTPLIQFLKDEGIVPGIKVDAGAKALPGHEGEKITEGLDGLRGRLAEYTKLGARFCKWRGVLSIGEGMPSRTCIEANAETLARYAALCQEAGLVPIVEPEILMDGDHTMQRFFEVSEEVLRTVFNKLYLHGIFLEGMILKPAMILPGESCSKQESVEEVSEATVKCFMRTVPAAVPGIAFLSGGQSSEIATTRLNTMNRMFKGQLPWKLTFSFGRAIQAPALEIWKGDDINVSAAQEALLFRAKCSQLACIGEYSEDMETAKA